MHRATVIELVATATTVSESSHHRDVGVRLSARLSDGRDVVLLDDRGVNEPINPRNQVSPEPDEDDLFLFALCVGPDGAFGDLTSKDMADSHFGSLAADLATAGIDTSAEALMTARFRAVWGDLQRVWPNGLDWY